MDKRKKIILFLLGAVFIFIGLYFGNINFLYLGIGTWLSGLIFISCYSKFKEITSMILGLLVLHAGVLLILKENIANIKLLGFLVFTIGIVFVLNSGFSEYIKNRKK